MTGIVAEPGQVRAFVVIQLLDRSSTPATLQSVSLVHVPSQVRVVGFRIQEAPRCLPEEGGAAAYPPSGAGCSWRHVNGSQVPFGAVTDSGSTGAGFLAIGLESSVRGNWTSSTVLVTYVWQEKEYRETLQDRVVLCVGGSGGCY
ncbi:MAG TPA: hypothetical protein VGP46_06560 [Acidimicrobiales bacterium]|nr:hypothetical protein [Acidimicrobiales bacterium]